MNELNPDAGSADELEAIRANQGSTGPQAPDVVDIALGLAPEAKEEGLLQPYMVETWDDIPDDAKDAEGYWYGDYYGVLAFEVNADVVENVPQTWADLLKPEYEGQIALAGDPRVSGQAIARCLLPVWPPVARSTTPRLGLDFFAQLAESGNLVPVIAESGTVSSGETPISIRWTYNALANRDANADIADIQVVVPADTGRYAGIYVQGDQRLRTAPQRGEAVDGVSSTRMRVRTSGSTDTVTPSATRPLWPPTPFPKSSSTDCLMWKARYSRASTRSLRPAS